MSGSVVSIRAMDSLVHRCVATMVVRVYGSLVTQQISGGQLRIMGRALAGEHLSWRLMLHAKMVGKLGMCRVVDSGDFAFGSILVAWFLERVSMLHLRVLLGAPGAQEPRLRQWSQILIRHGGGEGGHFFTAEAAQVWWQMPQIILQYPYCGVDFRGDSDMVLPPGEVFDHRGMFVICLIC
jgi:hypothetical protein